MPRISVVIPVYNVKTFLPTCLDSVCAQTLSDLEIILVDDGSTDESGQICDQYAQRDNRVRVIHKKNNGPSDARNVGIAHATAPYIGFVDGDDYIDSDMYELLYRDLQETAADIACCGLYHCYKDHASSPEPHPYREVLSSGKAIEAVFAAELVTANTVNKLFKRELFDTIKYPVGKTFEDAFICIDLMMLAHVVSINTARRYHYFHRSESLTTMRFNHQDLDAIDAWQHNYELIQEHLPRLLNIAQMRLCWAHFYVLDKICQTNNPSAEDRYIRDQVVAFLRKNRRFILTNPHFRLSRKWSMRALAVSYPLYRSIVRATARRSN